MVQADAPLPPDRRRGHTLDPAAASRLAAVVGTPHVVTDPDLTASVATDWTGRFRGTTPALVRPGSADEVAGVLDVCREFGLAVVPQGGNTGLVGGGVPLHGELVVSLTRLATVGPVDLLARQVTAGAGATLAAVQAAAAAAGLRYGVDLAARDSATIGGTIATNAGGLHLLRWGGTREQVLGVEAVLGDGTRVSHLSGIVKDNSGYDLRGLLCGSEGTLGMVTAARLRLVPEYPYRVAALVGFTTTADAVAAVAAWRGALDGLEAAELIVDAGLRLVCDVEGVAAPFTQSCAAYVLIEVAAHDDPTGKLAAAVDGTFGVIDVAVAADATRRAALWRYREAHTTAIATVGIPHKLDVTIPAADLAAFVDDVGTVVSAAAPGATAWLFGHVGDGNIHVNVTGPAPDDDRVDEAVLGYVASLGGSISAEHGIGTAKRDLLALTRSTSEIAAMRAVKRALDPDGILNPHAVLTAPAAGVGG